MTHCNFEVNESPNDEFYGSFWSNWSGWISLGGQITGAPTVVSRRPDVCEIFARGTDDLWQNTWIARVVKKDPSWGWQGCYMYQVCYLWWFYAAAVRTTQGMRERARHAANWILDKHFIKDPGFRI